MTKRAAVVVGFVALLIGPIVIVAHPAHAAILDYLKCNQTPAAGGTFTPCGISDFLNLFVYLAQWGLSIVAVLAVGMFIYGGFKFIVAGGRSEFISEGKRVMVGTVVGVAISLTAYIIINFTVTAITGTTVPNALNPLAGPIGAVFGNVPFSGTQPTATKNTVPACRQDNSGWNTSCSTLQVYCADPGTTGGGPVTTLQTTLNNLKCSCGTADGCFGDNTIKCLQRFQISNGLPPSGEVDAATSQFLSSTAVPQPCSQAAAAVVDEFPETTASAASGTPLNGTGCCVVADSDSNPLYCLDNASAQGCSALGNNVMFYDGVPYCADSSIPAGTCGYCSQASFPACGVGNTCFQQASQHWCQNIASQKPPGSGPLFYQTGRCSGSNCTNTVLLTPP